MRKLASADRPGGREVASVAHAIAILRLLSAEEVPRGVSAIARSLGLSPSSCLNLLRTLAQEQFAAFDPATKTYALGEGLVTIARRHAKSLDAFAVVRDRLAELSARQGVTSSLWRLTADRRFVLLGSVESGAVTRIGLREGQRVPMLAGAIGRCAAAHGGLPREQIKALFDKVRWQNPPRFASFLRDSEGAVTRGWAMDRGQLLSGVTAVSAPVLDHEGRLHSCLASLSFSGQYDHARLDAIGKATAQTAQQCATLLFGKLPKEAP
ncbi:IclR family transcriptional regulator [Sinimarinibacterium flocculans]|uniref:IclR family transcriptional regulator n=1 Tax=Sinimarinibacterium flocculans TaxID=985250 RepID=UPI0024903DFA|nr:IclR family transcriptional regulator [Sinimarinibacterium flocculans]